MVLLKRAGRVSSMVRLVVGLCLATSVSATAQRMVFAHYMLANQDYAGESDSGEKNIIAYEREIREAQAVGVDGFALNAGGWLKEPRYIRRTSEMFEAAYRINSNFKLMFSADMCCSNGAEDVEDMVRRFANNSRYGAIYYRKSGRAVLTTFAGSNKGPEFWRQLRRDLEQGTRPSGQSAPNALAYVRGVPSSAPIPVFIVPAFFWGGELPSKVDIQKGLPEYEDVIDGAFYWGIAGVPGLGHTLDQILSSDRYGEVLHAVKKLYMAPICFQFWGANAGRYYDYRGFSGMRTMWMDAINVSHPEWVEIITWNDFIEGTYVSPIPDPARYANANDLGASVAPPSTLNFFHSHRGATEMLKFFIAWYKTGSQPTIRKDALYWAYRTQLAPRDKDAHSIKLYGPVEDAVYVTANLTTGATLRVSFGSVSKIVALPAGSSDTQVPAIAGYKPHFELLRGTKSVAQHDGDDSISAKGPYPNFYYSTGFMY